METWCSSGRVKIKSTVSLAISKQLKRLAYCFGVLVMVKNPRTAWSLNRVTGQGGAMRGLEAIVGVVVGRRPECLLLGGWGVGDDEFAFEEFEGLLDEGVVLELDRVDLDGGDFVGGGRAATGRGGR